MRASNCGLIGRYTWHLARTTEKYHENPESRKPASGLKFEAGTFCIRSRSANNSAAIEGKKTFVLSFHFLIFATNLVPSSSDIKQTRNTQRVAMLEKGQKMAGANVKCSTRFRSQRTNPRS